MANFSYVLRDPYKSGVTNEIKKNKNKRPESILNTEETSVYLIFGYNRDMRFKCKTDLTVKPIQWDFKRQQMKQAVSGQQVFNDRLDKLKKGIKDYYNTLMQENPDITFNQLKDKIQTFVNKDQLPDFEKNGTGFFNVFQTYLDAVKPNIAHRTYQKYKTLKKLLETFASEKKKYKNLSFSQIDLSFFDEFKNYLLLEVKNPLTKEKGYLNDTISKIVENLKKFMTWSLERGYHKNREFQKSEFSSSRETKNDIITLKFSELRDFYNYDFSDNKRLDQVRDLFCFAAFTGQRWADIEGFKKEDIKGDTWIFKAQKTDKLTIIPFVGYVAPALEILQKYDFKLPSISNQKFNDYVKEAAEEAKLNRPTKKERLQGVKRIITEKPLHKVITMHTGRRTAVSLLLNVEKMPITQVMEITQHSDFETLKKYIDKDNDALRENLQSTRSVKDVELKIVRSIAQ